LVLPPAGPRGLSGLVTRIIARADGLQRRDGVLGFPCAVVKKYGDDDGGRQAALITYYGFLSIFPLLLLGVAVLSRVLADHPDLRRRLIAEIVPPALQAWPETDGPRILALARRDPQTQTVSLVLDDTTANIAMFAIAAHADEREAHLREVDRSGRSLPEGSYGRRNRQAIAARETRVAARLRAVEQAYRTATEHDTAPTLKEPARAPRSPELQAASQIDLEAEP
jgi:hypothetical protein